MRIPALINAARKAGLDRVVVTDHNSIRGALEARQLAPDLIIVGEEVRTTAGELLAAFVTQPVPAGLEPLEALKQLRGQGAFVSVSHPFDPHRSGWSLAQLEELAPLVDAIEIMNARALDKNYNLRAVEFARAHGLAGTAGSDAHQQGEIGKAALSLPEFGDAESLKSCIQEGEIQGGLSPAWVHLGSTWAKVAKKLSPHEIELK
jgi:predicted metal-dependent phosphoesterase TrpH